MEEKKPENVEEKGRGPSPGAQAPPEPKGTEEEQGKPGEEPGGEEELYDAIVPVGTPRSILRDVLKKFPVQLVERKMPIYFANMEGDEREVLAFRGPLKVVEEVERFIRKELEAFVETGGWRKEEAPPGS